jgi:hypothetical protein
MKELEEAQKISKTIKGLENVDIKELYDFFISCRPASQTKDE